MLMKIESNSSPQIGECTDSAYSNFSKERQPVLTEHYPAFSCQHTRDSHIYMKMLSYIIVYSKKSTYTHIFVFYWLLFGCESFSLYVAYFRLYSVT